jgi:hypothetical protein
MTAPWFDPIRFGELYGGIVGGGLGVIGAILGVMTGILTPKGKGRNFILGAFRLMILLGLVHLVVGLYAVSQKQPYGIWYPLVFIGGLLTFLFSLLRPIVRKRYEQVEMRKMDAAAFRRGLSREGSKRALL